MSKQSRGKVYIAGPMLGRPFYNFAEFDRVGGVLLNAGWQVISPADLDREAGLDPWELPKGHDWSQLPEGFDAESMFDRDIDAVKRCSHVCLLDGWTASIGARCEYFAGLWLRKRFICELDGSIYELGEGWVPVVPLPDAENSTRHDSMRPVSPIMVQTGDGDDGA